MKVLIIDDAHLDKMLEAAKAIGVSVVVDNLSADCPQVIRCRAVPPIHESLVKVQQSVDELAKAVPPPQPPAKT